MVDNYGILHLLKLSSFLFWSFGMDSFSCQVQCDEMDAQEYHMAQEWAAECERERWELWACVDEVEQREEDWREFWEEVRRNASERSGE